jgi:hypothetical protein
MCQLCTALGVSNSHAEADSEMTERASQEISEIMSRNSMDEAVKRVLDFYRENASRAQQVGAGLETAMQRQALAELMAGQLMFGQNPAAIAYGLAVMGMRYAQLLEQWAELYVTFDESMDLDTITTAEGKEAALAQSDAARTGMYL